MPFIEAMPSVPGAAATIKLDGLRVQLGRSLGFFEVPTGVSVVMHTPLAISGEVDSNGLRNILGQSNRLDFPNVYMITAQLSPLDRVLRVGTLGHHETEMLHAFWQTHSQAVRIAPIGKHDRVICNGSHREEGFTLPMQDAETVVFQALRPLR